MAKYLFILSKIFTSVLSVSSVADLPLLFHIERRTHGVLNKNKNYVKIFILSAFITTYRKKPLVVRVPFSNGTRRFVLRVESVFFRSRRWHGHEK